MISTVLRPNYCTIKRKSLSKTSWLTREIWALFRKDKFSQTKISNFKKSFRLSKFEYENSNMKIRYENLSLWKPVTRMLRVIMSPILSSLHNWLFQGDYGGVLKDSIFKDSIYGLKRDRSFWTKLYTIRSDGVISPLLIQRIDVILLVGRSMNLLKGKE